MSDGKLCYLVYETGTRNSAASKAPADVAEVCRRLGGIRLGMPPFQGREGTPSQKLWLLTVAGSSWLKNAARIPKGAIVLYQHPNYGIRLTRTFMRLLRTRRDCRFVALIHDLESLRGDPFVEDITPLQSFLTCFSEEQYIVGISEIRYPLPFEEPVGI